MKCIYVYNPNSGKAKSVKMRNLVEQTLREKFDEVVIMPTTKRGDAQEFAANACGKCDVLVVSGGDGTLNEIINGIAEKDNRPTLGYIPTGTCNDLAHSLKIPKNTKKALKIITEGESTKHDIFKAGEKYGIYVLGFGVFTGCSYTASQKVKKKIGQLAYYISGAKEIVGAEKFPIKIEYDGIKKEEDIILALIANGKYVSGYKLNRNANCTDGYVNIILFKEKKKKGISLNSLLNIFRSFVFGMRTLKNSKHCTLIRVNKIKVDINKNIPINIDGEKGFCGPFDFEVLPSHVNIFVKK